MPQTTHSNQQQILVPATLDVMDVERALSELWKQNAGAVDETEAGALMRARVLNLMVWVATEDGRAEVDKLLGAVSSVHPCRALVLVGEREAVDKDIEMFVSSRCQDRGAAGANRLCGEQITLMACGGFTVELPSAATPLLVSDLPVFLWWRDEPRVDDKTFALLSRASDRIIIDSADFSEPHDDLIALAALLQRERGRESPISDLNWSRATPWRKLLASFYDVAEYRAMLQGLSRMRVEYVAKEQSPDAIAPQALIMVGWLASRLGWRNAQQASARNEGARSISMARESQRILIEFQRVEPRETMDRCLTRVELFAEGQTGDQTTARAGFMVSRSEDGCTFETKASIGDEVRASRVVACAQKSEAALLGCELEILSHDHIYEEAIAAVAEMLKAL